MFKIEFLKDKLKSNSERTNKVMKNIIFSFFVKGSSILIAFIMVPLLIDRLTPESYGLWLTLTSFLSMFNFFNIGLGSGLKNLLIASIANGNNKEAKTLISTTYITLFFICIAVFICFCFVNRYIDWTLVLNASANMRDELSILALFVFGSILLQLVLGLIITVLQAYQNPAYGDFITVLGQFLSFVGVLVLPFLLGKVGLIEYGIIISLSPSIILLLYSIILFRKKFSLVSPSIGCYDRKYLKDLFSIGGKFFLIQMSALILYQSNNLIIAHVSGSVDVAVYNVAYKYASVFYMLFCIIIAPIWAAAGDAYVRGDMKWIHVIIRKLNFIWILFSVGGIFQLVLSQYVYKLWIDNSLQVGFYITGLCILYFILNMGASIYCNIINGTGKIKLQFIMYLFQVLIHIPLAIYLGEKWGIEGVLTSMNIIMFLNILWMAKQCNLLISQKAMGIWNT